MIVKQKYTINIFETTDDIFGKNLSYGSSPSRWKSCIPPILKKGKITRAITIKFELDLALLHNAQENYKKTCTQNPLRAL